MSPTPSSCILSNSARPTESAKLTPLRSTSICRCWSRFSVSAQVFLSTSTQGPSNRPSSLSPSEFGLSLGVIRSTFALSTHHKCKSRATLRRANDLRRNPLNMEQLSQAEEGLEGPKTGEIQATSRHSTKYRHSVSSPHTTEGGISAGNARSQLRVVCLRGFVYRITSTEQ